MEKTYLLIHILAAMVWFGSGVWGLVAVRRVQRVQGTREADNLFEKMELVENRIFPPSAIIVLLSGVALVMTNDARNWGDLFVILGLIGLVVSMAMGGALGGKINKELAAARDAEDSVATAGLINRWLNLGRIEILILLVVIGLMVFKPVL